MKKLFWEFAKNICFSIYAEIRGLLEGEGWEIPVFNLLHIHINLFEQIYITWRYDAKSYNIVFASVHYSNPLLICIYVLYLDVLCILPKMRTSKIQVTQAKWTLPKMPKIFHFVTFFLILDLTLVGGGWGFLNILDLFNTIFFLWRAIISNNNLAEKLILHCNFQTSRTQKFCDW